MLTNQRAKFDLPEAVTYLNVAYMGPQLRAVSEAGIAGLRRKARPWTITKADFFEPVAALKRSFAELVAAEAAERIALVPSASYGLAAVANNLPLRAGQEILVVADQFPSNYYPWERIAKAAGATIVTAPMPAAGSTFDEAVLTRINERTALVAMPHAHWATGYQFDLMAIRAATREVGAWLVIDGTQSIGALPFSVADIQPDALVAAAYKWLLGPYNFGFAYYGPALDGGQPIEENWINRKDSDDFRNLINYQSAYGPGAQRYNMGEQSSFISVPMAQLSLDQLLEWGVEHIQAYTLSLRHYLEKRLEEEGFSTAGLQECSGHLFSVKLPDVAVLPRLQEVLQDARVYVSFRGQYMRIAPHLYNDRADIDRLLACLAVIKTA